MSTDLTQSGGIISLVNALGFGGLVCLITLAGVFWTLHKHGGTLAIYLQGRAVKFEQRMKAVEADLLAEKQRSAKCEADRERDRQRTDDRISLLEQANLAWFERGKAMNRRIENKPVENERRKPQ